MRELIKAKDQSMRELLKANNTMLVPKDSSMVSFVLISSLTDSLTDWF